MAPVNHSPVRNKKITTALPSISQKFNEVLPDLYLYRPIYCEIFIEVYHFFVRLLKRSQVMKCALNFKSHLKLY